MKNASLAIFYILALLVSGHVEAQTICAPCTFDWDAPTNTSGIAEYRLYASQASGVYDWSSPALTVPIGTIDAELTSSTDFGTWYAVVVSSDGANISLPSNEVSFIWALGSDQSPTNLRLRLTLGADGSLTLDVERIASN